MAPISKLLILAFAATSLAAPVLNVRQLAGTGAALDSIFTDTDNGVGYGVENAEDNTANLISGSKGSTGSTGGTGGGNPPPPPPPPPHHRRQLDKIVNGFGSVANAAGVGAQAAPVVAAGDNIDGALTGGQANAGAQIGSTEDSTLEGAGSAIPRSL